MQARIIAVCKSDIKGVRKVPQCSVLLRQNYGLVDDAHADSQWHRQISLLAKESIEKMRQQGLEVGPGDFAENLTTEGIDLPSLPIGTRLQAGEEVVLEITQIGKECHTGCGVFREIGKCIMPKEGVFARVILGGYIRPGDRISIIENGK